MLIGLTKPMSANPPIQYRAVLTKEEALSPTPTYNDRHYPLPPSFNLARPNLSISPPVTGNTTKPSINYSSTNVTFRECWEAIYIYIYIYIYREDRGGTVVKVLCYKSEGSWFDPSWFH